MYLFLALLLVYVAVAAFAPTGSKLSRGNFVLGNALVVAGIVINWQAFLGTPPFRPRLMIAALFCGQILYMLAVLATRLSIKEAFSAAIPSVDIAIAVRQRPFLLVQCCLVATYEEFLWRATAQRFFGDTFTNVVATILITACLFTLLHQKMFSHNVERIEFLVFSVVLGLIYYLTTSLLFVVLVHAIRDINIKCRVREREPEGGTESPDLVPPQTAQREPAAGDVTRRTE